MDKKILYREHGREYSLMRVHVWHVMLGIWFEKNFGKIMDESFLVYRGGDLVNVYYDKTYYQRVAAIIGKTLGDKERVKRQIDGFMELFEWLRPYFLQEKLPASLEEFKEAYERYVEFWALVGVVYVIPTVPGVDQELKDMALAARTKTQEYNEAFEPIIKEFLEKEYPQLKGKSRFVLPEEVWSGEVNDQGFLEKIDERQYGFVFYQGKIYSGKSVEEIAAGLGFELREAVNIKNVKELKGQIAQKGKVRGMAKLVSSVKHLDKVLKGDILVASNTMPKYLPAMKRAAAFVTDEGGITCHAAIVAREMKKPCVIGTKIATQVLKDGDMVEVDADKGVVRKVN